MTSQSQSGGGGSQQQGSSNNIVIRHPEGRTVELSVPEFDAFWSYLTANASQIMNGPQLLKSAYQKMSDLVRAGAQGTT